MTYRVGEGEDVVRIELGGEAVAVYEEFDIRQGILTVPAAFSVRLGHGGIVREVLDRFPPRTPFKLYIGDRLQFCGRTDGNETSNPSGGTTITIHGRDNMAPLVDAFVEAERSFTDSSLFDMIEAAIVAGYPEDERPETIVFDNASNANAASGGKPARTKKLKVGEALLKAKLGQQFDELSLFGQFGTSGVALTKAIAAFGTPPQQVAGLVEEAVTAPAQQQKTVQAKVGTQWYSGVIKPELDRAGCCLWAAADGATLIASAPNPHQMPIAQIVRSRESGVNMVEDHSYRNVANGRYARCDVHVRAGGGKGGRGRGVGSYVDDEMVAWGFTRVLSIADKKATSQQQASELARRKIAETRRAAWTLRYTVAGLTTPALTGSGRVVWSPDTVVTVEDDELGLSGPFYVESVERSRNPQTTTTLSLMRPEDVLFSEAI